MAEQPKDADRIETTVPLLTGSDLQDPDAYRLNRVISDIYQHLQSTQAAVEETKQQVRRLSKPTALDLRSFLRQDPLAPVNVQLEVKQDEDWTFSLVVQWGDPASVDSVSGYEFACQYYEYVDGQNGPVPGDEISEEIPLGIRLRAEIEGNTVEFGPFPRQEYDALCQVRMRSISSENTVSGWVASDYEAVYSIARPVRPDTVSMSTEEYDESGYLVTTVWQMPANIGGTRDIEVQMRFYSDPSGQNPISDWILLGSADVNDGKLLSGPFNKPLSPAWARVRACGVNMFGIRSQYRESGIAAISQSGGGTWEDLPAPSPVQSAYGNVIILGEEYGIYCSWVPPNPIGSAISVDIQCRFWSDANLTQPITDWYSLGSAQISDPGYLFGWWQLADYDSYLRIRIRTKNAKGVASSWVESPTMFLQMLPVPSQPGHVSIQVLPDSDTHYRVRIFYDASSQNAVSWNLYVQFYADSSMTDPDGGPVLVASTQNRAVVPPNSYPYEELGPWPRNVDPRWVRPGVAAVNRNGRASQVLWASSAQRIDPVLAPPPPQSVSFSVDSAVEGGVDSFGFTVSVTVPSNLGTTEDYEAQAKFWRDSNLTQPDSDWITLGYFYPDSPTLVTDKWPKASYNAWAKVRVRSRNVYGIGSQWVESASAQMISAGSLNLNESNPSTIGEGLTVSAGKLKTKVDTSRFGYDSQGNITLATNRDLPVIVYTPPGSSYLGANIVSYNGQIYVWTGTQYRVDTNANQIKQQLQLDGLTAAEFASTFAPVRVLPYTPGSYMGDFIVNTTDRKLYRWNGSAYVRPMPGSDIKLELDVDKLTAGQIAAGAIVSSHIDTNGLTVRPSAGYPARFQIHDAGGNLIGAVGEYSGFVGLWAINGRFGGSFTNPVISLSSSGALISGADFELNKNNTVTEIKNLLDGSDYIGLKITHMGTSMLRASAYYITIGGNAINYVTLSAVSGYGYLSVRDLYGNYAGYLADSVALSNQVVIQRSGGIVYCNFDSVRTGAVERISSSGTGKFTTIQLHGDVIVDLYKNSYFNSLSIGGNTTIDSFRNGYLNSLSIGGSTAIDSNRNGSLNSLSIGGSTAIDVSRNGYLNSLSIGGSIAITSDRAVKANQVHWGEVYSETIPLAGITVYQWIPAYNSSGWYLGKIPIIP